jgi:leucyl aminopeptidase
MPVAITLARKAPASVELHAIAVTSDADADDRPDGIDWRVVDSGGFTGKIGEVAITSGDSGPVAVLGMGEADQVSATVYRRAGVALVRAARRHKRISADVLGVTHDDLASRDAAQAFAEGLGLGHYAYNALKTSAEDNLVETVTMVGSGATIRKGLDKGLVIAEGVNLARELVNEPGGSLTAVAFARKANAVAREHKLTIKVLDAAAIKRAKMGGLLGVNRGSSQQPRFVQMTYNPGRAKKHIALVGKGITFDSGGLSIKSGAGMMTMKCDMAGAAAVLGAMSVVAQVAPKVKVSAFMPLTDNMLGADATRPGDVLKIRNGKTVEVLNTDAEGRLVLADALSMASEAKPDAIIDLATLTGACMVALGPRYAGAMGTDDDLVEAVLEASRRTGERVWQLPLAPEYRAMLDSSVADVKNIGGAHGGAITAGLFLKEFVAEGTPWVHLDIAGPAFIDSSPWDEHPKGGTGFGVRLLLDLIEEF